MDTSRQIASKWVTSNRDLFAKKKDEEEIIYALTLLVDTVRRSLRTTLLIGIDDWLKGQLWLS